MPWPTLVNMAANDGNPFHCGFPMRCSEYSHMPEYAAFPALGKPFMRLAFIELHPPQQAEQLQTARQ